MSANGPEWAAAIAGEIDPDEDLVPRPEYDPVGGHAPTGIRIAQVVHHGTDHRSQVCTALSSLGVTPPLIDVWDFAEATGRDRGVPAPARSNLPRRHPGTTRASTDEFRLRAKSYCPSDHAASSGARP